MALVLKMQIDDKQEHQYIFSTGDDGTIELIPLNVVINGTYQAPEGKAYNLVTVEVPEITLEQLNVQHSGTYTAPSGTAYDVVTVDIPEYVLDALTATENGTFEPESGHVYNRVVVNVPTPEPTTETRQVTYTSNGTYTVNKSANVDGMTSVTVTVNVPTYTPNLEQASAYYDNNGNYTIQPSAGYDGIESVDVQVNVQGSQPYTGPLDLTGSNKITQNGTIQVFPYDLSYDYFDEVDIEVDVSGGSGGSADVITNTFTAQTNADMTIPLTIPTGKSIKSILIVPEVSDSYDGYSDVQGVSGNRVNYYYSAIKDESEVNPHWFLDGQYKSSTSYNGGFRHSEMPSTISSSSILNTVAIDGSNLLLKIKLATSTTTSTYGFATGITYRYYIWLK